jgi:hypothetical protein
LRFCENPGLNKSGFRGNTGINKSGFREMLHLASNIKKCLYKK